MAEIEQIPLRQQVRDRVAAQLWSGTFSFGDDLNEARLAEELGVSRTPLREGLVMLASEGLVEAKPNRGFHVPGVDVSAVAQLYPILGTLEALAVRGLEGGMARLAARLDRLNGQLEESSKSVPERYALDARWHEMLIAGCPNKILRAEIAALWSRARCIDGALMRGMADVHGSCADHGDIASAIREGDLISASQKVSTHWLNGIDIVTTWIVEVMSKEKDSK